MKNLFFIFPLLLLSRCGTDQVEKKIYNYTITNNSGVTVEIVPYDNNGALELSKKTTLFNGQKINTEKKVHPLDGTRLSMMELISKDENILIPKIEIVFNNTKKSTYSNDCTYNNGVSSNCGLRNIFLLEYNKDQAEVYTITPEDYQNATDCGGDCN
jgi:hypothetical protein